MFGLTALLSVAFTPPAMAQLAVSNWPMYQHDPQHTGQTDVSGPSSAAGVKAKWIYKASNSWIKDQVAIGPDGTLFIGNGKFPLCSLNPASGTLIWCTNVGGYVTTSSPAIGNPVGGNQTVYIGERNNVFWATGNTPSHPTLWSHRILLDGDIHGSPLIANGRVYMNCGCTTKGLLHAFTQAANGSAVLNWQLDVPGGIKFTAAAGTFRDSTFRLYAGTTNGRLVAMDDNGGSGSIAWTLNLATKDYFSSPSVGPDGVIYVGTNKGLFAVNDLGTHGQIRWKFNDSNAPGEWDTTPTIGRIGGRTFVYITRYSVRTRTLYAIEVTSNPTSTPTATWTKGPATTTAPCCFALTPSPVVDKDGIVYAGLGKQVFAFNGITGDEVWPAPFQLGPTPNAIADVLSLTIGNGVLYVPGKDSRLYALINK
jgi:outer membrane protein assembly factor BamB